MAEPTPSKLAPRLFGAADLAASLLVLVGVFAGLPARWLPVDVGALFAPPTSQPGVAPSVH